MGLALLSVRGPPAAAIVRGSPTHGPTASSFEPAGVPRPEAGDIEMGYLQPQTATSMLPDSCFQPLGLPFTFAQQL